MNLKQMEYFVSIVNEGNISAAAKSLHISQPPLSAQMKLLEDELIRFNHKLLQDVVILDGDYRQTAEYTGANSLFYFDPPYKPVNEGNSCTSYMPQDF